MNIFKHIIIVAVCLAMFLFALQSYTISTQANFSVHVEGNVHFTTENKIKNRALNIIRQFAHHSNLLLEIENDLGKLDWVKQVSVYRDVQNTIRIRLQERQAELRVYTTIHQSLFVELDEDSIKIFSSPNDRNPRTFICLGFPSDHRVDTNALKFLIELSRAIKVNPIVAENFSHFVYVNSNTIEMVNTQGSPATIVSIKNKPNSVVSQLGYMYNYITSHKGWNYYKSLNFKFNEQIVAVKN